MVRQTLFLLFLFPLANLRAQESTDVIELDRSIPANERGILCLTQTTKGQIVGGTTGRAAHLFAYEPGGAIVSQLRLDGGIGFSYALAALPDGSVIAGTQADPTGTARHTDPKQIGRLLRWVPNARGNTIDDLGVPVPGQGIYTLAYLPESHQIVGNTWPDGHFFVHDLKTRQTKDLGAIAGHRTFETPRHADDLNKQIKGTVFYPRQVSRTIATDPSFGALTAGKDGWLYRFDPVTQKLDKTTLQLPAVPGREPWTSLDAAVVYPRKDGDSTNIVGGTSEGHLFELRWYDAKRIELRPRGRALSQGTIQGLAPLPTTGPGQAVWGVGGPWWSLPRSFLFSLGSSTLRPGGIPLAGKEPSMVGLSAMFTAKDGSIYAGEQDRIARLLKYSLHPPETKAKPQPVPPKKAPALGVQTDEQLTPLDGWVVFAPEGTTSEGSAYTALAFGSDGKVYVGAARYGGYAWLLRFDPARRTHFMERVVNAQQLTGENLQGINTQGKIHALIIVGPDGRIWFATKQAHEIFGTRPEFGEDPLGYPGGHLCYYDPKTGFSRSMGILKKQEGLMAGVMDRKRNLLYYRSEPRNYFLSYNITTGETRELGHIGANCRYMAIDDHGVVYQPGRGNYLARFDPETGHVEDLAIKVEGDGGYTAPYVIQMGPNGKLYGAGVSHPSILEFDVDRYKKGAFPEVTVRNVAPAAPNGLPVHDIHAGIFGKDKKFYYPLVTTGPSLSGKTERHVRIMRFDPFAKRTETVGVPRLAVDEDKVKHVYLRNEPYKFDYLQGMTVGDDGTLFVMDIYPQLNVAVFPKLTAPK